jgi:N4-(beta-N-acetylglucosaminyl)-L-asparaginase
MTDRRKFLKTSALASAALLVNSSANAENKPNVKVNKPIVLSTWKFGLKCNSF